MIIAVSGTPGVGKTHLSIELAKRLSAEYVNITDYCQTNNLFDSYDTDSDTHGVDIALLEKSLRKYCDLSQIYVLDSHLLHDFSIDFVDVLIICTCELPVLQKRLQKRGYSEEKIRENLDAEIFQICQYDAIENGFKPIVVDCTKPLDNKLNELAKKIKEK